ncbi:TIGR04086 family membrane protein [Corynebacterium sp. P3-F1]|uniref:TIGR04086 family membrane protein n=1 Tax=Corynebacterium sp. P3-F1 TaxID=3059080 RepID=UPI00265CB496|nr:TIGR04086 family membrane protein [Corynebacterium sp. P3-F1]WKK62219.1 TIGR04086 family membrane protein [Corynebacterium sp. P3-F1]
MTTPNTDRERGAQTGRIAPVSQSHAVDVDTRAASDDHSAQESMIGTSSTNVSQGNVSWGAIFAGVVTFLAISILLAIGAGAMGLQGSSGTATGIFTVIGLIVAFLAAGYVAGALGVRAGLFHGFATWATSLIAALVLAGWVGASALGGVFGAFGNVADSVAQTAGQAANVTSDDARDASDAAQDAADNVSQQDIDNTRNEAESMANDAADQARETYNDVAPEAAEGGWWTFAGLLIGAVLASAAGAAGARSVINRNEAAVVTRK